MGVIAYEIIKLDLMKNKPSIELDKSRDMLFDLIPEFRECYGFDQCNDCHIYDVYNHTLKVIDGVPAILPLRIAALFHDMGKPMVFSKDENGIGHFYRYWMISEAIFNKYASNFNLSNDEVMLVKKIIFFHDLKLPITADGITAIKDEFEDDLELLFDLKKADILASDPKYHAQALKELEDLESIYLDNKKYIK